MHTYSIIYIIHVYVQTITELCVDLDDISNKLAF